LEQLFLRHGEHTNMTTYSRACILTPLRQTCVSELHKDPSALGSGFGHLALVPVNTTVKVNTHI